MMTTTHIIPVYGDQKYVQDPALRTLKIPGEVDNRFFDVNTTMRRLRKAFLIYTLLFAALIIAVVGLVVSCFLFTYYATAAAGIGICSLLIAMLFVLFAIFYWFAYKAWRRFYNPNAIQPKSVPLSDKLFPTTKVYKQAGGPIIVKPAEPPRVVITPSVTVPVRSDYATSPFDNRVPVYDGSRAARLPVEAKRSYNLNTSIGRIKKGVCIFTILLILFLIALAGLIASAAALTAGNALAAVGVAVCTIALATLLILLCIFYWKVWKTWRRFHRPSEFKINSEVAYPPNQPSTARLPEEPPKVPNSNSNYFNQIILQEDTRPIVTTTRSMGTVSSSKAPRITYI